MGMYWYVWVYMGMYGYVWVNNAMYRFVWVCMAMFSTKSYSSIIYCMVVLYCFEQYCTDLFYLYAAKCINIVM